MFTARGSATGLNHEELTKKQLETWDVNYTELIFGKPNADYYIDDKSLDYFNWFAKEELDSLECTKPARSQYSLTYLVPMAKVFAGLGEITLGFGESFPLQLSFSFNDGAGEVVYYLAPRVESEY